MTNLQFDCCQRFLFERGTVRGQIVRLNQSLLSALDTKSYPRALQVLLGESLTAAALLADTIKLDGSLIMQVQGDGPVTTLVAQANDRGELRGMAHSKPDRELDGDFRELVGDGRMVITIDAKGNERYQGVVALEGESLDAALEAYFARSEQLPTRLWLASDGAQAGGLLLQQLPGEQEDPEQWHHLITLSSTITPVELMQLSPMELINRLYHQESLSVYQSTPLTFFCGCSRDKIETVLLQLGQEEIEEIARANGVVSVQCEFCNESYEFDVVDVTALFRATMTGPETPQ